MQAPLPHLSIYIYIYIIRLSLDSQPFPILTNKQTEAHSTYDQGAHYLGVDQFNFQIA